ncbi:beta-lactamase regulator AmpE [Photorhabdus heterorhabditis]|uniref:Beta-lactamase regulator AmpE n=1 Tax=Photorhabdus heterorhabditis TaxID=880156 RepID=A0A5B0X6X2_9GAMM|nr:beta-lactamase regulator AmpE [Photorhabdus heterorhabditis]KAA1194982.1 beta-lactamase regulator AmpE [Photorhabdus heterorhabditis]KOY61796.1 transcriptional regulator [Photorhabdus heterorhabditis]MBS9442387.1 beta-lactamase regulator AmpE [Photorhabdus heterorhabditis]NRN27253.1 beta-lactamase regulator AmpE [Photorhabdus heterorhabditis subsp. aluminescens]
MTLFILLLVLAWERLFKLGDHWQLDHRLEPIFTNIKSFSLWKSLLMTLAVMLLTWLFIVILDDFMFGILELILWVFICLLCIGAGRLRLDYREYFRAVHQDDREQRREYLARLVVIHGLPSDASKENKLREMQNALLWINFRYYLAPIFWLIVAGKLGPVALMGYCFLRAYQGWLAQYGTPIQRAQSGVDSLLHWLDWIPARLAGVAYALLGHGERALPAWVASLSDLRTTQYKVVCQLAQFSLSREPHLDSIQTPVAAVILAKKVTFSIIVVVALLTIYGALV